MLDPVQEKDNRATKKDIARPRHSPSPTPMPPRFPSSTPTPSTPPKSAETTAPTDEPPCREERWRRKTRATVACGFAPAATPIMGSEVQGVNAVNGVGCRLVVC